MEDIIKNIFLACTGLALATLTTGGCLVIAASTISAAQRVYRERWKMKNAEKYTKQIANLIAEDTGCGTCAKFGASLSPYDGSAVCNTCAIYGICNSPDKLEKWLLEEDTRGHGNAQAPGSNSL